MYRIIFRTCDKINSLHQTPRPFGLDKRELIRVCFRSLVAALEGFPHSIHVIADDLTDEMTSFFKGYPVTITAGKFGNENSIRESCKQAFEYPDEDWVYLCEDDYLHQPQTFLWIQDLIDHREEILLTKPHGLLARRRLGDMKGRLSRRSLVIHPPDYPDRYRARERKPSLLFLSQYCHWRQISNTTFTFMAEAKTFKEFRIPLEASVKNADDGYLSKQIYAGSNFRSRALALSPIPGLTTHMHEGVMTPLVDWEAIMKNAKR
jgi:hypothetical protein